MENLHFCSQYIYSLGMYEVNNKHLFQNSLEVNNKILDLLIFFIYTLLIQPNNKNFIMHELK